MKRLGSCGFFAGVTLIAAGGVADAADPAEDANYGLEEVVVTAQRAEQSLEKTPLAVTAIGSAELMSAGISDPQQLQDRAPSLSIDRNFGGIQITIRGISSTDNTEKGDPSAAFLQDGIYIARPQVQDTSFFDLERVEILRGPQGTLYGRNSTAGLINVISARPLDEFGGSINASVGSFGARQITGVVNAPVSDAVRVRAAINYDRRDSYMRNAPGADYDIDPGRDNLSARLSASLDVTEDIDVLVRADYSRIQGTQPYTEEGAAASNFYALPFVPPPDGQRGTDPVYIGGNSESRRALPYLEFEPEVDNDTWGLMTEANWRLTDAVKITYLGSYREFERDELYAATIGALVPRQSSLSPPTTVAANYEQSSQELRLALDGDSLDLQTGVYYFKEESSVFLYIYGLNAPTPGADGYVFGFPQDPTNSESLAWFGQGTYSLTDQLRFTAGVRYTKDDKSRLGATVNHRTLDEPLDFVASPTNPLPDSLNDADVDYEKTTWRLGVEYDIGQDTMLYANVATGYKAGGFNDGCLAGAANCTAPLSASALFYDPEELTSYELGVRTSWANIASLFGTVFHYDYTDLQLSSQTNLCGGPCTITSNAGEAEVDGVEVELVLAPNHRNRFDVGATWLDAVYTDYEIVPGVNLAGEQLNRSPEWALSLGWVHNIPLANEAKVVFGVHSRWSDEYVILSSALRANFRQPSFTKTDVSVGYHAGDDRWYVDAFCKNLEDEVTIGNAGVAIAFPGLGDGEVAISAPRTYGVRIGYTF
jgi:iron complex outermembrane recepter protein